MKTTSTLCIVTNLQTVDYDCSDGPALAEVAVSFCLIESRPVLARCRSKLSNRGGRRRFLLAEPIIPPMLNKRSTAADDGNATLYSLNKIKN